MVKKGRSNMKIAILLITALLLSGCGSKIDGTYCDRSVGACYTFRSNGTVLMSVAGTEVEMKYEVDGDKIEIAMGTPQGGPSLTMLKDGSIQGPIGMKLTKQKQ
jgi:hypothetical protein